MATTTPSGSSSRLYDDRRLHRSAQAPYYAWEQYRGSTGVGASLAHTYLAALGNPFRSKRRAALGLIAACDSIVPANINMVDVCLLTTQPSQIRVSASLYFHLAARHWPAQPYSWHWLHSCSLYT
jgi:hypothetical protein